MSRRLAAPLAGFLLTVSLSGCAASQSMDAALFTVVYNGDPPGAFRVPLIWKQVDGPALARELQEETGEERRAAVRLACHEGTLWHGDPPGIWNRRASRVVA